MLCDKCERFCAEISQKLRRNFNSSDAETEFLPFDTRINIATMITTSRWPSHEMELFGSLKELKSANQRQCSICRCLSRCIEPGEVEQLPGSIYKTFLMLTPTTGRPSLRVRLMNYNNETMPTEILTENVAIYNPSITKSPSLVATPSRCSELENGSTGSPATFELAKYWLNECLENHSDCPKPASGKLPTRLVDVRPLDETQSLRLVESRERLDDLPPSQKKYVALSHCWGKQQILTTTLATLCDRKAKIRMDALSNTFRDAVIATRRLGLRFLWIDSLCIIQDSADDWKNESIQMCAVYQGAVVTIAAAHASSGNGGCFAQRDGSALLPFSLPLRTLDSAETTHAFFLPLWVPRIVRDILDEQPLLTRAWVLQEQVLSRALLLYHSDQLRWECHTTQKSERSPDGASLMRAYDVLSHALVGENDPFQPIKWNRPDGQVDEDMNWDMHRQWCKLVVDYTRRGITKTSDRLIALDGIAQTMSSRTSNRYVAGLWSDQLLLGLIWGIPWDIAASDGFWEQAKDPTISLLSSRHEMPLAPTWSWASVTFPVIWSFLDGNLPQPERMKSLCKILNVDAEGTPFSMSGKILIQGLTQRLFVDPTYQHYHFSGISKNNPKVKELGILDYMVADPSAIITTCSVSSKSGKSPKNFHPFPMRFTPDQLIDRTQEVTFLALTEIPPERFPTNLEHRTMPIVLTLALVPTGTRPNEYRRVGLALWYNCSWYGYFCIGETYQRSHWKELQIQKITRGWRTALKDFFNKCLYFLVGGLLNQPIIQQPVGKLTWFSHLANGKWGRHRHSPNSHPYRKGWEAKWETITIV